MRKPAVIALLLSTLAVASGGAEATEGQLADAVNRKVLRVCATPANLPYSDEKGRASRTRSLKLSPTS